MKENELMLRDWVLKDIKFLEDDPMYTETDYQPYQIIRGEDIDLACETNWLGDDVYQPIPLTAEILAKNGFVRFYVNYVNYWKMQVDNVYIELRPTEGNMAIWFDYDKDNDGIYANYILPYPDNLHQLQHALRLCNIEKEIEL